MGVPAPRVNAHPGQAKYRIGKNTGFLVSVRRFAPLLRRIARGIARAKKESNRGEVGEGDSTVGPHGLWDRRKQQRRWSAANGRGSQQYSWPDVREDLGFVLEKMRSSISDS